LFFLGVLIIVGGVFLGSAMNHAPSLLFAALVGISFLVLSHWCDSSFYENQARVLLDPRASVVAVAPHRGFYITHDSDVVVSLPDALDDSKDHIKVESLVFKRLMDVGLNISCPESARDAIDLAVSHALGK